MTHSRTFIIMWCNEGLETVLDATNAEKKQMWATLKGEVVPGLQQLNGMVLRARFNSQREYEIYAVDASPGVTSEDIKKLFLENPKHSAEIIREKGRQLFSDKADILKL